MRRTDSANAATLSGWVSAPDENGVSAFVDVPAYLETWPATVLVGDCEIVPDSTYHIRGTVDAALFSYPLVVATTARPEPKAWGDICGPFDGVAWSPPNGTVNFDDVFAALMAYQAVPSAPHVSWADIEPETPNVTANINDVFQVILAFQGSPYPFANPDFCP